MKLLLLLHIPNSDDNDDGNKNTVEEDNWSECDCFKAVALSGSSLNSVLFQFYFTNFFRFLFIPNMTSMLNLSIYQKKKKKFNSVPFLISPFLLCYRNLFSKCVIYIVLFTCDSTLYIHIHTHIRYLKYNRLLCAQNCY